MKVSPRRLSRVERKARAEPLPYETVPWRTCALGLLTRPLRANRGAPRFSGRPRPYQERKAMHYVGIDVGSTATKVAVLDAAAEDR